MSDRQRKVLEFASIGLRDRHIAVLLGVSTWTVKSDVCSVLAEFEARSRTQAVAKAIRAGAIA